MKVHLYSKWRSWVINNIFKVLLSYFTLKSIDMYIITLRLKFYFYFWSNRKCFICINITKFFPELFYPKIHSNAQYNLSNLELRFTGLTGSDCLSKISSKFFSNNFTLKSTRMYIITNKTKILVSLPVKPEVMTHQKYH